MMNHYLSYGNAMDLKLPAIKIIFENNINVFNFREKIDILKKTTIVSQQYKLIFIFFSEILFDLDNKIDDNLWLDYADNNCFRYLEKKFELQALQIKNIYQFRFMSKEMKLILKAFNTTAYKRLLLAYDEFKRILVTRKELLETDNIFVARLNFRKMKENESQAQAYWNSNSAWRIYKFLKRTISNNRINYLDFKDINSNILKKLQKSNLEIEIGFDYKGLDFLPGKAFFKIFAKDFVDQNLEIHLGSDNVFDEEILNDYLDFLFFFLKVLKRKKVSHQLKDLINFVKLISADDTAFDHKMEINKQQIHKFYRYFYLQKTFVKATLENVLLHLYRQKDRHELMHDYCNNLEIAQKLNSIFSTFGITKSNNERDIISFLSRYKNFIKGIHLNSRYYNFENPRVISYMNQFFSVIQKLKNGAYSLDYIYQKHKHIIENILHLKNVYELHNLMRKFQIHDPQKYNNITFERMPHFTKGIDKLSKVDFITSWAHNLFKEYQDHEKVYEIINKETFISIENIKSDVRNKYGDNFIDLKEKTIGFNSVLLNDFYSYEEAQRIGLANNINWEFLNLFMSEQGYATFQCLSLNTYENETCFLKRTFKTFNGYYKHLLKLPKSETKKAKIEKFINKRSNYYYSFRLAINKDFFTFYRKDNWLVFIGDLFQEHKELLFEIYNYVMAKLPNNQVFISNSGLFYFAKLHHLFKHLDLELQNQSFWLYFFELAINNQQLKKQAPKIELFRMNNHHYLVRFQNSSSKNKLNLNKINVINSIVDSFDESKIPCVDFIYKMAFYLFIPYVSLTIHESEKNIIDFLKSIYSTRYKIINDEQEYYIVKT